MAHDKKKYIKEWRKKNKEHVLKYHRNYYKEYAKDVKKQAFIILNHLRRRCKRDGHVFDLKPEDVVIPTHCPVLGAELNRDPRSPFCISIDRLRPELGYVKGNIVLVSKRANQIKSDASLEEIEKVLNYYTQVFTCQKD